MKKKLFHISDVLCVVTGQLLSTRGMQGVCDILNFMTEDLIWSHQIPRVLDECKPHILRQFPVFESPEIQFALGELNEMFNTPTGKSSPQELFIGWLSKLATGKYGIDVPAWFDVEKIPNDDHEHIDPMSELVEKIHPKRIIVVDR